MAGNKSLHKAKKAKEDEFYTQLSDIENELKHYKQHFKDKIVLCNCDDPYESNFFKYFALNFNELGLKKLISTCYNGSPVYGNELMLHFDGFEDNPKKIAHKVEITEVHDLNGDGAVDLSDIRYLLQNGKNVISKLKTGDFNSKECIDLLQQVDIVVTNPPFSLFREYVESLIKYGKYFLIIGNQNAITYKEIFPLIKSNQMWLGYKSGDMAFRVPSDSAPRKTRYWVDEDGQKWRSMGNICWFTNLDIPKRHEDLILHKHYTPEAYPKYDNYDAINVDKTTDIPCDYYGVMGVPITFLAKYNPSQFEIVEFRKGVDGKNLVYSDLANGEDGNARASEYSSVDADRRVNEKSEGYGDCRKKQIRENTSPATAIPGMIKNAEGKINGKITYARITIRRKLQNMQESEP